MAKPLTHIKVPSVESDYENRDESEAQLDCMSTQVPVANSDKAVCTANSEAIPSSVFL
jgi:hypothetical protein